ncbi:MAG: carbohydrate kinase family protein [Methanosarcinales archaeon]
MDVIGFGALNLDKIIKVDKIPKSDEEGYIHSIEYFSGGSAANTIVGLSRLGLKTGYIGKIGDDTEGKILLEDMQNENVDVSGIKTSIDRSGTCLVFVDGMGNRAILVDPGVNDTITIDDINLDFVKKTKFLHLTSFVCKESIQSFETQKKLIKELETEVSFDPGQLYAEKGLKEMEDIIKRSKVVLPSEYELKLLTGFNYKEGAQILLNKGVEIVGVKLGEKGCYITDGSKEYSIPAYKTKVVDTTGAGDAFNAGFLYGLIKGKNLEECGKLGNKVASFCIQKKGAKDGLPRLHSLDISNNLLIK